MEMEFSEKQLMAMDKDAVIQLFLSLQGEMKKQSEELHALNEKMQLLMEQVILSNKARFGRSTEKAGIKGQLHFEFVDGDTVLILNEAEAESHLEDPEPEDLLYPSLKERRKKQKGKRAADMEGLDAEIHEHYLSQEQLEAEFGEGGWKRLPDTVVKRYPFSPAKITVEEHHIGVYAGRGDGTVLRAPYPKGLLKGSPVTPSLASCILDEKYVSAVPLYRQEQRFSRQGLCITRRQMANWVIRLSEEYFGLLYDVLKTELLDLHVIQADETPFRINRDGRKAGSKSYMWVYRSGCMGKGRDIILYDSCLTRSTKNPREFLKGFSGICVTDGYQVYQTLEKEKEDLKVAGCWVHCRRRFVEASEVVPKNCRKGTLSSLLVKQIQAIYREEGKLRDLDPEERLAQRNAVVKPLVDAFFACLETKDKEIPAAGKLREAVNYARNQESHLRVFLEDGEVPIDNNASERAIRGFTIGRKNWQMIDTVNGADASAVVYSIAETAKANGLKTYEYFRYLLEEIPKHMEGHSREFLRDLLPWSEKLPEHIRQKKKDR